MATAQGVMSMIGVASYQFGTGACFIGGTRVNTLDGYKEIQDIKEGDYVLSFDPNNTDIVVENVVIKTYIREVTSYIEIKTKNGITLNVTQEHPFFSTKVNSFIRACDLSLDSTLMNIDGSSIEIKSILLKESEFITNPVKVYDIKIDNLHTFFVEGLGVHNKPS